MTYYLTIFFYADNFIYKSKVNQFIIENILPVKIFNDQNKPVIYKNEYVLYSWGKILSRILIDSKFELIDPNYEVHYYLNLYNDLVKILVEYEYYVNNISKREIIWMVI